MPTRTASFFAIVAVAASALLSVTEAFASCRLSNRAHHIAATRVCSPSFSARKMTAEDSADVTNGNVENETQSESDEDVSAPPVAEEEKVDPEVTELKEQLSELESQLRMKRAELSSTKDLVEKYSKAGYIRQVASVENRKRMRGSSVADSKEAARATVVQSFVPVLEELQKLGSDYEGNVFASSLRALQSGMENAFQDLEVTEYTTGAGSKVDGGRVVAATEEFSTEFAKGTVISTLKSGLEIRGNVVRPAECVASLGSENANGEGAAEDSPAEEATEKESVDASKFKVKSEY